MATSAACWLMARRPAPWQSASRTARSNLAAAPVLRGHAGPGPLVLGQIADRDGSFADVAGSEARDQLAQLPDVAGIGPLLQVRAHRLLQRRRRSPRARLPEKALGQGEDVLRTFAQGRQLEHAVGQPVVEIGAEGSAQDVGLQIAVGCADQTEARAQPAVAADPLVGPLLDHAQQLRLQRGRQLTHLVEKESAAVGQGEGAVAWVAGPGERAPFVPEEFAARQLGGHGGTVEYDELALVGPAVERVHQARSELLAGAAFPDDEQVGVGETRCLDDLSQCSPPGRAVADQIVAHQG